MNETRPAGKNKFIRRLIMIIVILILIAYAVIGNLVVNVALVPSFMRKLDAFEELTEQSYSEMIYTDDITENMKASSDETLAWFKEVPKYKESIKTKDGYTLIGAVFRNEDSHDWVLIIHGYTGWKEEMYHFAARYYKQGFNVICPDLRCHGESEGDFIGLGYTDSYDNLLWLEYINDLDKDARIVIHGESMGASCALMMSGLDELPDNVTCVVSDCAFTDALSIFRKKFKEWTGISDFGFTAAARVCLLARGGYDVNKASALKAAAKSRVPTLFIQGLEDRFVPPEMVDRLYEACSAEKQILKVEGAGHVQSSYKDPENYYNTVFEFINKAGRA